MKSHRAGVRGHDSCETFEEGRLAGAVGANQAQDLPALHGKTHAIQRQAISEALGYISNC